MANPNSEAASVVIAFGTFAIFAVLIGMYLLGTWKLNFTECTAGGIRTRRVFWIRQCSWSEVSDISVECVALSRNAAARGKGKIRVVKVRRTNGPGFYLGAPIDRAFRPDPDFDATVLQIQSFWGSVGGPQPHPWPRPGSLDTIAPG
jgi:hypothetical protein